MYGVTSGHIQKRYQPRTDLNYENKINQSFDRRQRLDYKFLQEKFETKIKTLKESKGKKDEFCNGKEEKENSNCDRKYVKSLNLEEILKEEIKEAVIKKRSYSEKRNYEVEKNNKQENYEKLKNIEDNESEINSRNSNKIIKNYKESEKSKNHELFEDTTRLDEEISDFNFKLYCVLKESENFDKTINKKIEDKSTLEQDKFKEENDELSGIIKNSIKNYGFTEDLETQKKCIYECKENIKESFIDIIEGRRHCSDKEDNKIEHLFYLCNTEERGNSNYLKNRTEEFLKYSKGVKNEEKKNYKIQKHENLDITKNVNDKDIIHFLKTTFRKTKEDKKNKITDQFLENKILNDSNLENHITKETNYKNFEENSFKKKNKKTTEENFEDTKFNTKTAEDETHFLSENTRIIKDLNNNNDFGKNYEKGNHKIEVSKRMTDRDMNILQNSKDSLKGWRVLPSRTSMNSKNYIRDIIDHLPLEPNPEKKVIALSIGECFNEIYF